MFNLEKPLNIFERFFYIYYCMITKLYEYNMYNKRLREIRHDTVSLINEYKGKNVKFFIKIKLGRNFREFQYNEIVHSIKYDNMTGFFTIDFKKDDTYIIVKKDEILFHERYERIPKRVLHKGETLTELIDKIRKI